MKMSLTRADGRPGRQAVPLRTTLELMKPMVPAPKPYTTPVAEVDLRVGGASKVVMKSPDGQEIPCPGQYLEVVPGRKLVFTDAFTGGWVPKDGAPFMVATISFEPEAGKTRYTATVRHWSEADRAKHEQMGFYPGWGQCADQLEALAKTI